MGEEEALKWDIRYVENRRISKDYVAPSDPRFTRRNFHVAYLVSLIHQNPEAIQELLSTIREAIERANRGETGRDILLGKEEA